ncbi:MAG TPA: alkaline phosphatase family protein [Candidatus Limnocylindria bacterium]|nr:alkaline phosphatase family protein [Candidatus Limnocylindria bacterium]
MRWRPRLLLVLLLVQGSCAHLGRDGEAPLAPADVYLVVVDGLDIDRATPERMPHLTAAVGATGSWLTAHAVMPTRTNPNHASLLTGTQPSAHGITGNRYWDGTAERDMLAAPLLETETLLTAIERQRPALVTLTAFAKGKLRDLFGKAPGRQAGPDIAWHPASAEAYAASDEETMQGFRALVARHRPAFAMVALADVDGAGHREGPDSDAYRAAVATVDRLIGAFLSDLRQGGRWRRSVVMVTTDHGFDALLPGSEGHIGPADVVAGGAHLVAEGGAAWVHAGRAGSLEATVAKAERHPGVAAVYARKPLPGAPAPPASWHTGHPRAGDLLLIARPGYTFVEGPGDRTTRFRGNHGGPGQLRIPLVIVGGHPALRRAPLTVDASAADVAPTAAYLLGVAPPRRLDGTPVPAADAGRALLELVGGQ